MSEDSWNLSLEITMRKGASTRRPREGKGTSLGAVLLRPVCSETGESQTGSGIMGVGILFHSAQQGQTAGVGMAWYFFAINKYGRVTSEINMHG